MKKKFWESFSARRRYNHLLYSIYFFFFFFISTWLFILLYFTALAKDIIENHFDNYSKHLCKGLQEQIYALTNQKEELTWQLSQRLTNSSEVPSTNNKAKLENSLKTAYQNLVSFKFATNSFAYICEDIHTYIHT